MNEHTKLFRIKTMSRVLGVSRSGFYAWRARQGKPSAREQWCARLDQRVAAAFAASKGRNGSPRLERDLVDEGHCYDRKSIAASLRRQGLRAKAAKKFKATTNSKHSLPVAPNRLGQDFTATAPNQKWAGDITYLWTDEGWLYLAVVIDLYARRVVGWAMSERMTAPLVCDALIMALWRRHKPRGVIVHSDSNTTQCQGLPGKVDSHSDRPIAGLWCREGFRVS